jgi:hypothetical protein
MKTTDPGSAYCRLRASAVGPNDRPPVEPLDLPVSRRHGESVSALLSEGFCPILVEDMRPFG